MADSILTDTKKILGLAEEYEAFDPDIIMHINSVFTIVTQLGIGPVAGFAISSKEDLWDDLAIPLTWLGMVKTYVYLKVRLLFDPPATSFHIAAMEKQIEEHETRLSYLREDAIPLPPTIIDEDDDLFIQL